MEERNPGLEMVRCALLPSSLHWVKLEAGRAGLWRDGRVVSPQGRCWHRGLDLGDSTLEAGFGDFPKMPSLAVAMGEPQSDTMAGVVYSKRQPGSSGALRSPGKSERRQRGILPGRLEILPE